MATESKSERIIGGVVYEDNYASGDYKEAHLTPIEKRHVVPLLKATKENLEGYGELINPEDYFSGKFKPKVRQWPQEGWRPVAEGTGTGGGTIKGKFITSRFEDYYLATNTALNNKYIIGRVPAVKRDAFNSILCRQCNFHPDGDQSFIVIPDGKTTPKFILLLAKPTHDVKLEDFRAFLFEGYVGFNISHSVYHKPAFAIDGDLLFYNEQGSVHAVVCVDTYKEFGKYLEICY